MYETYAEAQSKVSAYLDETEPSEAEKSSNEEVISKRDRIPKKDGAYVYTNNKSSSEDEENLPDPIIGNLFNTFILYYKITIIT